MVEIASFRLRAVDLPFRLKFRHAAAVRETSSSLFLSCTTTDGTIGWGEALPRPYVTGESQDGAFELLHRRILPRMVGRSFPSLDEVRSFLTDCNGKAPPDWVPPGEPQCAAWSVVDLALLDTVGRATGEAVVSVDRAPPPELRYSGVISADHGWSFAKSLLKQRLFGLHQAKLKVEKTTGEEQLRILRRWFGRRANVRADANMAWTVEEAVDEMRLMARFGITSFEQPLPADDLDGLARLVAETDLGVMADESFSDADSLATLVSRRACTAVNARISKCGGLVATERRCREALDAGLTLQVGCQVGESSLLSSAHLALLSCVEPVTYAEGCFGLHLLEHDPATPCLQFRYGGRPPRRPSGPGLGVTLDEALLDRFTRRTETVSA